MTARNGSEPAPRGDRIPKGEGNLSAETVARLQRRTEAFQSATQRKGQPLTYGVGKEPLTRPKGSRRKK
jgi:hypothetical protein